MRRIVAAAAVFYVVVAAALPPDVFYSGDGGVKVAQARSLLASRFSTTAFVDPAPELHAGGALFPLGPPFAYWIGGRFQPGFAPAFAAAVAPFYAAFGFRGLRVVPVLGAVLLLVLTARLLRALAVPAPLAAATVGFVAVATPVAFYAVQLWEHVPFAAVVVGTVGLAVGAADTGDARRALAGGVALGLGALLREEAFVLAAAVAVGLSVARARATGALGPARAWTAGALVGAAAVLAFNLATTGHLLGLHALQVPNAADPVAALARVLVALGALARHAPFVALAFVPWPGAPPARAGVRLLRVVIAGGALAIPALAPNTGGTQWGPRYLLPLLPLAAVAAASRLADVAGVGGALARGARAAAVALALWGAADAALGARALARTLDEKRALVDAVRGADADAVLTPDPWVAQNLAALWFEVPLVRAETPADVALAVARLGASRRPRVLVVGSDDLPSAPAGVTREPAPSAPGYRLEAWRLSR
jgi:hypothetical protein